MLLSKFKDFCLKTQQYPPVVLFGHIRNPTNQEKKAEQRIVNICEELYKIDSQVLAGLRASFAGVSLCELFKENLKDKYLIESSAKFLAYLKFAHKALETMHKKDPILVKYFYEFKLNKEDFDLIWKYTSDNLKETTIEDAAKEFKSACIQTEKELKG